MNVLQLLKVADWLKSMGLTIGDLNVVWARVQEFVGAKDTNAKMNSLLEIARCIASKTKNQHDDQIIAALLDANANGNLAKLLDAIRGVQSEPVFASAASDGPSVELTEDEIVRALAEVMPAHAA